MVNSCAASNCTQRHEKGVMFHEFPKNEELRKKWIEAVQLMRPKWVPTQHSQLCCKHFGKDCYRPSNRLKKDAVPTIFSVSTQTAILLGLLGNDMNIPTAQFVSVSGDVGISTPDIGPAQSSTVVDVSQQQDPQVLDVWPAETIESVNVSPVTSIKVEATSPASAPQVVEVWPVSAPQVVEVCPVPTIKVEAISSPSTPEDHSSSPIPEVTGIYPAPTSEVVNVCPAPTQEISNFSLAPTLEVTDNSPAPTPKVLDVCSARTSVILPVCNGADYSTCDSPPTKRMRREDCTCDCSKVLVKAKAVISKKTKQLKVERQRVTRGSKKITELEEKVDNLKKKLSRQKSAAILKSGPERSRALFAQMLTAGSQGKEYPDELKSFAVTLEFYSPKAYDYVRKTFNNCLPHRRTLQKWHEIVSSEPEVSTEDAESPEPEANL